MYACGLRISEAATLEIPAIDSANRLLRVIGKGNKERRVPLPQPVLDDLRRVWARHRNRRWLFPNASGTGPVTTGVLVRTFTAVARQAGLAEPRRPAPHTLRHRHAPRSLPTRVPTRVVPS